MIPERNIEIPHRNLKPNSYPYYQISKIPREDAEMFFVRCLKNLLTIINGKEQREFEFDLEELDLDNLINIIISDEDGEMVFESGVFPISAVFSKRNAEDWVYGESEQTKIKRSNKLKEIERLKQELGVE